MTAHPNRSPTPPDDWRPAAGGEVVRLTRHMRARKSRRQFLKVGGGVVASLLAVAGGWAGIRAVREPEYNFGGITCHEALARADAMMKGQKLPEAEVMQVKEHVTRCPNCKPKFEQMGGTKLFARIQPACRRPDRV
jgi:hypothetical protein